MQIIRTIVMVIFVGIVLFPFPSQTLGQQTPAQQMPGQQPDLSENQLRSFAKVYVQIEKIRQTYEPQLKEAKNPEEGNQIKNEAMSKMHQALAQEGMDEQTYNRIFEIARTDEGVHKKVIGFINEERQKS